MDRRRRGVGTVIDGITRSSSDSSGPTGRGRGIGGQSWSRTPRAAAFRSGSREDLLILAWAIARSSGRRGARPAAGPGDGPALCWAADRPRTRPTGPLPHRGSHAFVHADRPARDVWIDAFDLDPGRPRPGAGHAWSVTKRTLRGGRRDGVDLIELDNGALSLAIVPTRGMGLWKGRSGATPWAGPRRSSTARSTPPSSTWPTAAASAGSTASTSCWSAAAWEQRGPLRGRLPEPDGSTARHVLSASTAGSPTSRPLRRRPCR